MATYLQRVFSGIARKYEQVNHIFTLGLDVIWRQLAVRIIASFGIEGIWLDICSGTGEMAQLLSDRARSGTRIIAADFSPNMLAQAKRKKSSRRVLFTLAEAEKLPFKDKSLDIITISFATRNLTRTKGQLVRIFREFNRVLRHGGVFLNLETSQPDQQLIRLAFHKYVDLAVNHIGPILAGSKSGYAFLANTVQRFYDAETLAWILRSAGFQNVTFKRILLGIAAIHVAVK